MFGFALFHVLVACFIALISTLKGRFARILLPKSYLGTGHHLYPVLMIGKLNQIEFLHCLLPVCDTVSSLYLPYFVKGDAICFLFF